MNKFLSIALIMCLILAALPGIGLAQGGEELAETFLWQEAGLSLAYPTGWTAQILDEEIAAVMANPADVAVIDSGDTPQAPLIAILVTDDADFFGTSVLTADIIETAQNLLDSGGFSQPEPPQAVTFAGLDAARIRSRNASGSGFMDGIVAFLPDGRFLMLMSVGPLKQEAAFAPLFEAALASFTLDAGEPVAAELGQTLEWTAAGLTLDYPAGWTTQLLNEEITALLANPADIAVFDSDVTLQAPIVGVVVTGDENFFGPGTITADLMETAQNWLSISDISEPEPLQPVTVAGLEAVRVRGLNTENQDFMAGIITFLPDGRLLLILSIVPGERQAAFTPVFNAMLDSLQVAAVETAVPAMTTLDWAAFGISLDYPATWTASEIEGVGYAFLANPDDDPGEAPTAPGAYLLVWSAIAELPADMDASALLTEFLEGQIEAEEIVTEPITVAGYEGAWADFQSTEGNQPGQAILVTAPQGVFVLFGASPPADSATLEAAFAAMVESIAFMPPPTGAYGPGTALAATFSWPEKGFSMAYPAGWREASLGAQGFVLLANPADDPQDIPTAPAAAVLDAAALGVDDGQAIADEVVYEFAVNLLGVAPEGTQPAMFTLAGYDASHIHSELPEEDMIADVVALNTPSGVILLYFTTPFEQYEDFGATLEAMVNSIVIGAAEASSGAEGAAEPVAPLAVVPVDYATLDVTRTQPLNFDASREMLAIQDGHGIVYHSEDGALCTIRDDGAAASCIAFPEIPGFGRLADPFTPFWPASLSPNGQWLAVVGSSLVTFRDGDLTLVNVADGSSQVVMQDDYDGNFLNVDQAGVSVEVQPVWSPDGTQIAFEQTPYDQQSGDRYTFGETVIAVLDLPTGETQPLAPLPKADPEAPGMGSTSGLAWSPDGSTLAVMVRLVQSDPAVDGLYLLDAASGELTQLASMANLLQLTDLTEGVAPGQVSWSPNGDKLLITLDNPQASAGSAHNWFWVDLVESSLYDVWQLAAADGEAPINSQHVTFSPDGSLLLLGLRQLTTTVQELLPLDPNGEYAGDVVYTLVVQDLASNEVRLLGHLPYTSAALQPVWPVWGPENDVLMGGYALKLVSE